MASVNSSLVLLFVILFASATLGQTTAPSAEDSEAAYTQMIAKRVDAIVVKLNLADAEKAARVRDVIIQQYRGLRDWHAAHPKQVPAQPLHDQFLEKLSRELSPQQIDLVKNDMTYNVLNVTYDAFCDMIPTLTTQQKVKIREWLTEARELAMDGDDSKQKHAIFGKYKGRINNYLSKEGGYDLKAEENAWRERLKARRAATQQSKSGDSR